MNLKECEDCPKIIEITNELQLEQLDKEIMLLEESN